MPNLYLLALAVLCIGCTGNDQQNTKPIYNEPSLKQFVLSTHDSNHQHSATVLDSIIKHATGDSTVFLQTITYLEQPFGSPNSAYRNDSLYSMVLNAKSQSKWIDTVFQRKARERVHLIKQNQPGTIANDFTYQTPSGYERKLHGLKAKYTLLFFYNPECPACKEMKAALTSSTPINHKIQSKELTVLAVYTDKDESLWLNHLGEMPKNWMHGRDRDEYLYKHNIYDLRAIPTLYLLDADKKVLLKDCVNVSELESALR